MLGDSLWASDACPPCPQQPLGRIWQSLSARLPVSTRCASRDDLRCKRVVWSLWTLTSPPSSAPPGAYPPPIAGGVPPPWPPMMDNSKPWEYYPRREDKRDKERDRPRERTHDRDRERERDHSPTGVGYNRSEHGTHKVPNCHQFISIVHWWIWKKFSTGNMLVSVFLFFPTSGLSRYCNKNKSSELLRADRTTVT